MIFNNQLFYSRVTKKQEKKKQKSFDKFCLQSASTFDRELHVSNQSALMIVQKELEILVNSIVHLLSFAKLNSRLFRLVMLIFVLLTQQFDKVEDVRMHRKLTFESLIKTFNVIIRAWKFVDQQFVNIPYF